MYAHTCWKTYTSIYNLQDGVISYLCLPYLFNKYAYPIYLRKAEEPKLLNHTIPGQKFFIHRIIP